MQRVNTNYKDKHIKSLYYKDYNMSVQVLNTGGYRDKDSRIQHANAWTTTTNGDRHRRKEGHANSLKRLQHVSLSIEQRWIP